MTLVYAARQPVLVERRSAAEPMAPTVDSPTLVRDVFDDTPVALVVRYPGDLGEYRRALQRFPMTSIPRTGGGFRSRSATFGYAGKAPMIRRYSCRPCGAALKSPDVHAVIAGAAPELFAELARWLPDLADDQYAAVADRVDDAWRLGNSPWTGGIINDTAPLPYHTDGNNLAAWSAMVVCRRGAKGGHLHIPEYGLVLPCRDGDVIYFPGYRLLHGVTPIRLRAVDAYRYTAVYYPVAGMVHCGSPDEELERGRRYRSDVETNWRERQGAMGLVE